MIRQRNVLTLSGYACAVGLGILVGRSFGAPVAYAEGNDSAAVACVLRNIQKIQNVHSQANWSPMAWLITECARNPSL
jgi:hypothetical protein